MKFIVPMRASPYRCLVLFAVLATLLPLAAQAVDRTAQRARFGAALAASETGHDSWKPLAVGLEDYPLFPYLEYNAISRSKQPLQRNEVESFLKRWPGILPTRDLRDRWLRQLGKAGDWRTFLADFEATPARDIACLHLQAQLTTGEKIDYATQIEPLWLQANPSPDTCASVFATAQRNGHLDRAKIWQRIDLAAEAGEFETIRDAAVLLDVSNRIEALRIADAIANPTGTLANASTWPDQPRNRDAISHGLRRYARRNSGAAETVWTSLQDKFKWDTDQKNRILNAIAVYRSTNYSDDALARLNALPDEASNDVSREWLVRTALASGDYEATLKALRSMRGKQREDERWRYLEARMLSKLKRDDEARPVYAALAREANFYGFLAADWIDAPYSICPIKFVEDKPAEQRTAEQPDLLRAFEFHALGKSPQARREWDFALTKFDDKQSRLAADLAYRSGWYDRAVFALSGNPETQRMYEQRFPLGERNRVVRESRAAGIDPSWAYGIIRAESAWMSDARSHANAYGLMQLLPGTAKRVANAYDIPFSGSGTALFDTDLNISLGTRYLGMMAQRYAGSPWLASAAYNAGPAPVDRWLAARSSFEPDFFIETIPYKETREYVSRVLAFSVIYDWHLNGKVSPLSSKLPRIGQAYIAPSDKSPRKAVVCATTAAPDRDIDADSSTPPATPDAGSAEPVALERLP
ncbi:MAG: transglycosylase SLT domain-containing protein [Dokdonella sp.]